MQQAIGLALVALQAALMGLLSQSVQFPLLIVILAAFGAATRWRISLSREQAFLLSATAAFFFLLKHRFSPSIFPVGTEFIRTEVAFLIAQFLLLIEAAQFLVHREEDALSPVLPALGAVALICIADIQITGEQRTLTQFFAVGYALLWAIYLWTCRKPMPVPAAGDADRQSRRVKAGKRRKTAAGFVLGIIAVTAWMGSWGLYEFEKKIEDWLIELMAATNGSGSVGFSRTSRLGSLAREKSAHEQEIALWVYSQKFPGYFRGAVFVQFASSTWESHMGLPGVEITKNADVPQGMRTLEPGENLFAHPSHEKPKTEDWQYWECWQAGRQAASAFTPLGTTHLITPADRLGMLAFGEFVLPDVEACNPYTACVPVPLGFDSPTPQLFERWLQVPEEYQPHLKELAAKIFANARTPAEKITAVERYFQDNYRYHLGIEVPTGEDPLLYFLREKPAAHCEYFASAAALLLRIADVPTRYVTGFVPAEWNPAGKYWVARNRDAHAWVEAYAEPQGWITVEATPAEGVPSADQPSPRFAWWETLSSNWRRLRTFISQKRWGRAWSVVRSTWLGVLIAVFLLGFLVYLALRIPWPRRFFKRRSKPLDPGLAEMQQLLKQVDHNLHPHGLARSAGETLHQFAGRIAHGTNGEFPPQPQKTPRPQI